MNNASPLLHSIDFEVTERCNLRCQHCYISRDPTEDSGANPELDCAFICALLEEAAALGCKRLNLTGGEPLLRADFPDILLRAHRLGFSVALATNATLISDDIADLLVRIPLGRISISIYGWDEASFQLTTGYDKFAEFIRGTERLRARRVPFRLRYPATVLLADNVGRLRNLSERLGASTRLINAWELTLHARRNLAACCRISEVRLSPERAAIERLKVPGEALANLRAMREAQEEITDNRLFPCRVSVKRFAINAHGGFLVCPGVRHPELIYDLRTGSLQEATTSHLNRVCGLLHGSEEFLQRCGRCALRRACGPCPAYSWTEHGLLDAPPEYYCQVMHRIARYLGVLNASQNGWEAQTQSTHPAA